MNTEDLMKDITKITGEEFERKLNKFLRENYRYKNLDENNKQFILDFVKRYRARFKDGLGLSGERFKEEMYNMRKNRSELGLTEEDTKDIEEILSALKR